MGIKHVCDLCGTDADGSKFIIPVINRYYATGKEGIKLMLFSKLEPREMNLCKRCQAFIAGFINAREQFDKED